MCKIFFTTFIVYIIISSSRHNTAKMPPSKFPQASLSPSGLRPKSCSLFFQTWILEHDIVSNCFLHCRLFVQVKELQLFSYILIPYMSKSRTSLRHFRGLYFILLFSSCRLYFTVRIEQYSDTAIILVMPPGVSCLCLCLSAQKYEEIQVLCGVYE